MTAIPDWDVRLLGPVELESAGGVLRLSPLERSLVALLALSPGRVVSVDRIIDALWDDAAPASARTRVQALVSSLRARLGAALVTRAPGYLLDLHPDQLDLTVAERRRARARAHAEAGRPHQAAEAYRAALALWRGDPLGGTTTTAFEAEAARLRELRMATLEERVEVDLALGDHAELAVELAGLAARHPLRERVHGQLMLALYRAGRQADALHAYRTIRRRLVDELGVEPGAPLQALHHAILTDDPSLRPAPAAGSGRPASAAGSGRPASAAGSGGPASAAGSGGPASAAGSGGPASAGGRRAVTPFPPAQLPPDIPDFTGREKQVAAVCDLLTAAAKRNSRAVSVVTVTGMGGIGKTALAVHVAHRTRDHFPDGQLYVNLHGAQPDPVEPAEVLARFLRALGVDGPAVPASTQERCALYRSRLAGSRVLVVLDDAHDDAQIGDLLPGGPGCAVLVTSRTGVPGPAGGRQVQLDVFEPDQALALLAEIAGPERIAAEPGAADDIVRLCGHVALAVRIAGARLAARPHWRLARLADILRDERHRLDELSTKDSGVRASLELSYGGLAPDPRRTFRLLGLLTAPDVAGWVAGCLLGTGVADGERQLDALVEAQLLGVVGTDGIGELRYRCHDLVRLYARERAEAEEPEGVRRAALERALGAWLSLAREADRRVDDHLLPHRPSGAPGHPLPAPVADRLLADPVAWFETERLALRAAAHQAAELDLDELAWDLAGSLTAFCELRSYHDDARDVHQAALRACRRRGNRRGEAVLRRNLALAGCFGRDYRYATTIRDADAALALFRDLGDRPGEVDALFLRGLHLELTGALDDALACQHRALRLARAAGYRFGEIHACHEIGTIRRKQTRYADAAGWIERGLALAGPRRHQRQRALLLSELGIVRRAQRRYAEATACLETCLGLVRDMGAVGEEMFVLLHLGRVYVDSGNPGARPLLERCLRWSRQDRWPYGEAFAQHALGDLDIRTGHAADAVAVLGDALAVARRTHLPDLTGQILDSLAHAEAAPERTRFEANS